MGAIVATIPADFSARMKRLIGLKFAPTDLTTHWEALRDLADEDLDAAISRAARECDEFPSPKMLRSFVALSMPRIGMDEDRSTPLAEPSVVPFPQAGRALHVTREWVFYCDVCRDGGWASYQCSGDGACGRERCPYAHEYVKHCECWDRNPALIRKRQRAAQQAHQRTGKDGS